MKTSSPKAVRLKPVAVSAAATRALCRWPLRLRIFPDPVLRAVARPLELVGHDVGTLAEKLLQFMRAHHGIGLAAPQVGLSVRLIVADIGEGPVCLVNPVVAPVGLPDRMVEGCLSLPDVTVEVERASAIEVHGFDPTGKPRRFTARGLLARVLQHEVDHLDGRLIIDHRRPGAPEPASPVAGRSGVNVVL
jgi:peptide deformylase